MAYDPTSSLDHAYADSPDAYDKRESPAARAKREIMQLNAMHSKDGEIEFHGAVSFQKGSDGRTVVLIHPDLGGAFGDTPPPLNPGYRWIAQQPDANADGYYDVVQGAGTTGGITGPPAGIENFLLTVSNPNDNTQPSGHLHIGDNISELLLKFGVGNTAQLNAGSSLNALNLADGNGASELATTLLAIAGLAGNSVALQVAGSTIQLLLSITGASVSMEPIAGKHLTLTSITTSGTTFYAFQ